MRWEGGRESDNVEDREGESGIPGRSGPPLILGGGLGTLAIVVIVALLGGDPIAFLQQVQNPNAPGPVVPGGPEPGAEVREAEHDDPAHEELKRFVRVVLADTEDVWGQLFLDMGRNYRRPKLVLYSRHTRAGCGLADSAVGPFYCPADETVYLDLSFFAEMRDRFKAPGEFAAAYVIAHEIGHHVQKLLGTMDRIDAERSRVGKVEGNHLSVRLELQADFYAGVWANRANKLRQIIESGDVEAALRAANAIGDDRLQKQARGYVVPDSFTHGTSAQRIHWFRKGLETGDVRQGDTFRARDL
jgi:predicted metalloprotease